MDVLGSASFVLQNEALTQNRLATDVYALASGLRVRSAADDPSGYTIHESLDTKIAGLQQSVTNVQTANNLMQVAESALSNVTTILQRIRSLIVESNSDINSQSDLQNIQAEIDQLLLEINKIASDTTFNGLQLFTGQFQVGTLGSANPANLGLLFTETPPFPNPATQQTGSNVAASGGQFITPQQNTVGSFVPTFTVWSIVSASNNMIDPDTGINVGPGVLLQEVAYSTGGGAFGPTPLFVDYSAVPDNTPFGPVPIVNPGTFYPGGTPNLIYNINLAGLGPADVGAQAAFLTQNPVLAPVGTNPLTINDGGNEGQTISISLPGINTNALNISDISVLDPQISGIQNIGGVPTTVVQGVASSNNVTASYSEIEVDAALQQINTARAQIGAQTVSLQQDANSDNVAIVNLTAASSNIRDANIGATVTDFTKQQILVNVGNSVLAQMEVSATQLTALLLNSFAGLGAAQGAPATTAPGGGQAASG
jgi:flagellin